MSEMRSALDSLAGEDLRGMFGPQLLERLGELLRQSNRLAAEVARTVRECELTDAAEADGLVSMASWLRGHGHFSARAAGELVASGRALEQLPALAQAFAEGAVTAAQVGVVSSIAGPEQLAAAAAQGIDLAVIDQAVTAVAVEQPYERLAAVVRYYRQALDPDGAEPDPTEGRRLSFAKYVDGTLGLSGQLDAVGGEKLQAALEAIVQAGRCTGDTRTRAQQLADALVQLADNALASGELPIHRTVKPHVVITIDAEDLAGSGTDPGAASTGFGQTLSAARARWLACDASITRIVLGPDGLPLDVGRAYRVVPPHLRRAVEHRDRQCVFTGCDAPTHWCDVHHPAIPRGPRRACESWGGVVLPHIKVHHGFRVERDPGGRWHTWRPDGTEIELPQPLRI